MNFFEYNNANGNVELAVPEILLISEFKALMDDSRNKCDADKTGKYHLRAFREFTYIWLAIDWKSPYSDYAAQDKWKGYAKSNDFKTFMLLFKKDFPAMAAARYEQNEDFFVKMFSDPEMMKWVMESIGSVVYERLKN